MVVPKALTIAGSDSGGGAGIQADLKTFSAFRVFGMSVITAVTAQNSVGVQGVFNLPPEFIGTQIHSVLSDFGADAVKIGMLSTAPIIAEVARRLRAYGQHQIVLDPVMIAKSGDPLLEPDARAARRQPPADAAREAKAYVTAAIREGFRPGRGVGALRHFIASW